MWKDWNSNLPFGVNKCAAKNYPNPSSIYLEIIPSFECFKTFSCIKFKNGFLNASIDIDGWFSQDKWHWKKFTRFLSPSYVLFLSLFSHLIQNVIKSFLISLFLSLNLLFVVGHPINFCYLYQRLTSKTSNFYLQVARGAAIMIKESIFKSLNYCHRLQTLHRISISEYDLFVLHTNNGEHWMTIVFFFFTVVQCMQRWRIFSIDFTIFIEKGRFLFFPAWTCIIDTVQ